MIENSRDLYNTLQVKGLDSFSYSCIYIESLANLIIVSVVNDRLNNFLWILTHFEFKQFFKSSCLKFWFQIFDQQCMLAIESQFQGKVPMTIIRLRMFMHLYLKLKKYKEF